MAGVVCCCVVPLSCVVPRPLYGVPCLRIRSGTPHCLVLLVSCCLLSLCVAVLLCCVRGTGGWCVWCVRSHCERCITFPPLPSCVRCHSVVGLGLCLCDRVVSLWNRCGDLCGAEGRVVSTVYTHPCCGGCFSGVCCDGSACLVLSSCVVGCGIAVGEGCAVSLLVFLLFHHLLAFSLCWCSG